MNNSFVKLGYVFYLTFRIVRHGPCMYLPDSFLLLYIGVKTHTVVVQALDALTHLDHRGAAAADPLTGDGVGITTQVSR